MAKRFQITVIEKGALPKGMKGKFRRWLKEGWFALAAHWHAKYRPLHFSEAGYWRYGYERYDKRYLRRKQNKFGHKKPLVWTGESKRLSENQDIRGTSKEARVVMRVPTLNRKGNYVVRDDGEARWYGPRRNMRAMLQKVNKQEVRGLEKQLLVHFTSAVRGEQQWRAEAKL